MTRCYLILFLLILNLGTVNADNSAQDEIDSLLNVLSSNPPDTMRVKTMNRLAREYQYDNQLDNALKYGKEALTLARKINYQRGKSVAFYYLGSIYYYMGDYPLALKNYKESLEIDKSMNDLEGVAGTYIDIGNVYDQKGDISEALSHYNKALEIRKKLGDKEGEARCLNNIGVCYGNIGDYSKALENYFASLRLSEEAGDEKFMAGTYNNIGIIYHTQKLFEKARENYLKALEINERIGNTAWVAKNYGNIGIVYYDLQELEKAMEYNTKSYNLYSQTNNLPGQAATLANMALVYQDMGDLEKAETKFQEAVKISEKVEDKAALSVYLNNLGSLYLTLGKHQKAKEYSERSLQLAYETGSRDDIKNAFLNLSAADSALGNWKNAYLYHKIHKAYHDSIFNEESTEAMAGIEARYESEKKEAQIKLLQKDKERQAILTAAENRKQQSILWTTLAGLLLGITFSGFMYNRWKVTGRQKKIIESQKVLVDQQKAVLEEKNKDITDSINYAKRIQDARLPMKEHIRESFPNNFVLFKPKDIVSGDFYWYRAVGNYIHLAAADCTGHGVPGAFMSLIGSEKLDEAINDSHDPSVILNLVNKGIRTSLSQTAAENSTRDGMDIALCCFEKLPVNGEHFNLSYAGANRPLWIFHKASGEMQEIKPTKKAIGGLTGSDQQFERHDLTLKKGDTVYMFSDGFADTFNGKTSKKLMTKRFRELLADIQEMEMPQQETYLNDFLENWQAGVEQVDDILVIGIRI